MTRGITDLARTIARSDPDDAKAQADIRETLTSLRDRVQGEKANDVRLRLDSALLLADYLTKMEAGGDEVLRIISRLIASMDPYFTPQAILRKPRSGEEEILEGGFAEEVDVEPEPEPTQAPPAQRRIVPENTVGRAPVEDQSEHVLLNDMLLGEILVQFGTINSQNVVEALELQKRRGLRFGDALISLGAATRSEVQTAVAYQENLRQQSNGRPKTPSPALPAMRPARHDLKLVSDMMLGDLLVRMGKITDDQLELGLRTQRATGVRIGEALVQVGATDWETVNQALRVQSERRVSL